MKNGNIKNVSLPAGILILLVGRKIKEQKGFQAQIHTTRKVLQLVYTQPSLMCGLQDIRRKTVK